MMIASLLQLMRRLGIGAAALTVALVATAQPAFAQSDETSTNAAPVIAVIAGVIVIGLGVKVGTGLARRSKGSLRIELPKTSYAIGEAVVGRVLLTTKKELEGQLCQVALIATERETETSGVDDDSRSVTVTQFHQSVDLAGPGFVAAGLNHVFDFSISTPDFSAPGGSGLWKRLSAWGKTSGWKWRVDAYQLEGLDLKDSKKIKVKTRVREPDAPQQF